MFRVVLHIIDFRVTYFKTIPSASSAMGTFTAFGSSTSSYAFKVISWSDHVNNPKVSSY